MSTGTASASELVEILESTAGLLADLDVAELPSAVLGDSLVGMERVDAVLAAARRPAAGRVRRQGRPPG